METTEQTFQRLNEQLRQSADVVRHDVVSDKGRMCLLYIKSMCDQKKIHERLIVPFHETGMGSDFSTYLLSLLEYSPYQTAKKALEHFQKGIVIIFYKNQLYLMDFSSNPNNSIEDILVESVVQGPTKGLSEDIEISLTLIRSRYPQPTLRVMQGIAGSISRTRVAMLYDERTVDPKLLQTVKFTFANIDAEVIQTVNQLQLHMNKKKRTLFPTMLTTERPDRIVYNLAQGKIVFLLNGTHFALVLPAVFFDFMTSMEDLYQSYWVGRFTLVLRYVALLISLTLAAWYVALTSFSPEVLRVQLSLSIAGSRATVPYPSYVEVMFMLVMMEMLTEASIRLPKSIGSTATTVGGLILGQAATQAGLVSNIMIIIVASVAISNFVIPINTMTTGLRVSKYVILLLATIFGLLGILVGTLAVVAYLVRLDSFGQPYLRFFYKSPFQAEMRKTSSNANGGTGT